MICKSLTAGHLRLQVDGSGIIAPPHPLLLTERMDIVTKRLVSGELAGRCVPCMNEGIALILVIGVLKFDMYCLEYVEMTSVCTRRRKEGRSVTDCPTETICCMSPRTFPISTSSGA